MFVMTLVASHHLPVVRELPNKHHDSVVGYRAKAGAGGVGGGGARTHTAGAGVGGARAPSLTVGSYLNGWNLSAPASYMLQNVCFKYFRCFRGMLQVFHIDVAKVDQNVAYVTMAAHVCCKRLFQMFYLFVHMYVTSVFIYLLDMFYTYFASVLIWMLDMFCIGFQVFLQVF
jgi:hypothetical protein